MRIISQKVCGGGAKVLDRLRPENNTQLAQSVGGTGDGVTDW